MQKEVAGACRRYREMDGKNEGRASSDSPEERNYHYLLYTVDCPRCRREHQKRRKIQQSMLDIIISRICRKSHWEFRLRHLQRRRCKNNRERIDSIKKRYMRNIFLLVLMFSSLSVNAQSFKGFINNFKAKKIDSVIGQCTFPFELRVGSKVDDERILTAEVLRKKLQQLFREKYFDELMIGKFVTNTAKDKFSYESRTFNKKGELESESAIIFYFNKGSDGSRKLYKIMLAG